MQLKKVLDNLASSLRSAKLARKTSSHLTRYRHSSEVKYSRLYGYRLKPDGTAEIIPAEAEVIRIVIEMFAAGRSVEDVKAELDKRGMKNRSGKRISSGECMSMVRDIYSGLVRGPLGTSRRSTVYPPIVQAKTGNLAKKTLKKQVESASRPPSRHAEGGRNDATVGEAVSEVGEAMEDLFSESR